MWDRGWERGLTLQKVTALCLLSLLETQPLVESHLPTFTAGLEQLNKKHGASTWSPQRTKSQVRQNNRLYGILFWSLCFFVHILFLFFLSGGLWSRLGPSNKESQSDGKMSARLGSSAPSSRGSRQRDDAESDGADDSEDGDDDSQLQKMWGAMIKQKEQRSNKMKKSRLDNLPSLQIEISRDSSNGSDSDSWDGMRDLN